MFALVVLAAAAAACSGGGGGDSKTAAPAQRHLVYVAGDTPKTASVWIANVDGTNGRRLTSGFVGILSPDGTTVAVQRARQGLFLVSSDGKRSRRLTPRPLRPQAWSPDGQTVYATATSGPAVTALEAVDRESGKSQTIASGSLYGFDISPDGDRIVYSRAPKPTDQGICGDQFDLYTADLDGGSPKRLTHDGLSAFPVWGGSKIAFSHFPGGQSLADCGAPGVWTVNPDGSAEKPIIRRAPDAITLLGYYGFQPIAWLDETRLLVGLRTATGTRGAVLDTGTKKMRQLNVFADEASSDGRYAVGAGGDEGLVLSLVRTQDGHKVFTRKNACCPDWNR